MLRPITTLALICSTSVLSAQASVEPAAEVLRQFEGTYLFHGTDARCTDIVRRPHSYYECRLEAVGSELRLTGFVGNIDSQEQPYFTGTYDPEAGTICFSCGPEADGDNVYDEDGYRYFIYDFTLSVGTDSEGRLTLSQPYPLWFYTSVHNEWLRASYSSLTFTKDAPMPTWNGNVIHHVAEPTTLEELLTYTLEFEDARSVTATDTDIQGYIFDENGEVYALAFVNGVLDPIGSLQVRESCAIVHFVRLADYDVPSADSNPLASQSRLPATPGQATVLFRKKSFKVDGSVVRDDIVKTIQLK